MMRYVDSLRSGLQRAMSASDRVVLLGEDILDPYGGAFKVTRGLSLEFPDRLFTTPISESAIVGLATGLAARGYRPVGEIMFGDFLTLCTDQIVNSATKFPLMYKGKVFIPWVLRTPMGGGRGYGPTHSQSIEKMFLGVPGLVVLAPSLAHDPGSMLEFSILNTNAPVLFIEEKIDYPTMLLSRGDPVLSVVELDSKNHFPICRVQNYDSAKRVPDVVIITYGGAAGLVFEAMRKLAFEEIHVLVLVPSQLNDLISLRDALLQLSPVEGVPFIVAENGTAGFNWGSEVALLVHEVLIHKYGKSSGAVTRLYSEADVIPSAKHLEARVLLTREKIMNAIYEVLS
jgi:pyruvate/2-oxoglutarate/acetoin dehydrogenase E1 component